MKENFMLKQLSEEELLGRSLSEAQKQELLALMDKSDEDIDLTDIPEVRELPPGTIRGGFRRGRSVHLSPDVHAYFSTIAARKGGTLDVLINDILRKDVALMDAAK